jgi:hypothetical protein
MPLSILVYLAAAPAVDRHPPWVSLLLNSPISALVIGSLLLLLFVLCFLSMTLKSTQLRRAQEANEKLLASLRVSPHPLSMLQAGQRHLLSPLDGIYQAGSREMAFHLTGSNEVTFDFLTRLRMAAKISPSQLRTVESAMQNAIIEARNQLDSKMALLGALLRNLPWLACLTPLLVYLERPWDGVAGHETWTRGVLIAAFAPVGLALLGTSLSMLRLQLLAERIRAHFSVMESFANELENSFDHSFVDHSRPLDKLPSMEAFATEGPSFNLPPNESPLRTGV